MVSGACVTSGRKMLFSSNLGLSFSMRGCSCGVALLLVWYLQWPLWRNCKTSHVTQDPVARGSSQVYCQPHLSDWRVDAMKTKWDLFPASLWNAAAKDCVEQFHEKLYVRFCRCLRPLFGTPFGPWTFIKLEFSDGSFEIGLVNPSAWSDGHCPHAARSHSFVYISTS